MQLNLWCDNAINEPQSYSVLYGMRMPGYQCWAPCVQGAIKPPMQLSWSVHRAYTAPNVQEAQHQVATAWWQAPCAPEPVKTMCAIQLSSTHGFIDPGELGAQHKTTAAWSRLLLHWADCWLGWGPVWQWADWFCPAHVVGTPIPKLHMLPWTCVMAGRTAVGMKD